MSNSNERRGLLLELSVSKLKKLNFKFKAEKKLFSHNCLAVS
jgi:hypothetical protein